MVTRSVLLGFRPQDVAYQMIDLIEGDNQAVVVVMDGNSVHCEALAFRVTIEGDELCMPDGPAPESWRMGYGTYAELYQAAVEDMMAARQSPSVTPEARMMQDLLLVVEQERAKYQGMSDADLTALVRTKMKEDYEARKTDVNECQCENCVRKVNAAHKDAMERIQTHPREYSYVLILWSIRKRVKEAHDLLDTMYHVQAVINEAITEREIGRAKLRLRPNSEYEKSVAVRVLQAIKFPLSQIVMPK